MHYNNVIKKQWGNACWYLFHTLAYKLKEEHTNEIHNILNHNCNM